METKIKITFFQKLKKYGNLRNFRTGATTSSYKDLKNNSSSSCLQRAYLWFARFITSFALFQRMQNVFLTLMILTEFLSLLSKTPTQVLRKLLHRHVILHKPVVSDKNQATSLFFKKKKKKRTECNEMIQLFLLSWFRFSAFPV